MGWKARFLGTMDDLFAREAELGTRVNRDTASREAFLAAPVRFLSDEGWLVGAHLAALLVRVAGDDGDAYAAIRAGRCRLFAPGRRTVNLHAFLLGVASRTEAA